jgi:AraC-like DNA-binding protein
MGRANPITRQEFKRQDESVPDHPEVAPGHPAMTKSNRSCVTSFQPGCHLDREGWRDLRDLAVASPHAASHDADRMLHVERMARFIGEKATEEISVEHVAAAAGLHPNYAMTLFKRSAGLTINQSIIRHRLDTAQSMLIATELPVAAIAFDCGFGSLSRFREAFHQRFHTSPKIFRQRINQSLG